MHQFPERYVHWKQFYLRMCLCHSASFYAPSFDISHGAMSGFSGGQWWSVVVSRAVVIPGAQCSVSQACSAMGDKVRSSASQWSTSGLP